MRAGLIERNTLIRAGLKLVLGDAGVDVPCDTGEADVVAKFQNDHGDLDIILVDPAQIDAERLQILVEGADTAKVVALADGFTAEMLMAALKSGCHGYLTKDRPVEALVQSLRLVMLGEKVFPSEGMTVLLQGGMPSQGMTFAGDRQLSPREVDILRCLVEGNSNKHIAIALDITEATVKVHLKSLMRKIGVNNRTQAAIWAMNKGISANASAA